MELKLDLGSSKRIKSNSKNKSPGRKRRLSPKKKFSPSPYNDLLDDLNKGKEEVPEARQKISYISNTINNYKLLYSPRTTFSKEKAEEAKLFNDLAIGFDPITIKLIKNHFKERLGVLKKNEFVAIVRNHLLGWHPNLENRQEKLTLLLGKLFGEIDLNNNQDMEWEEFTNYILHSSSGINADDVMYKMRYYSLAKCNINSADFTDIIIHSIYLPKYNFIGLVQDGRSVVAFYDATTGKKIKASIDVKSTQNLIDQIEIYEYNVKTEEYLIEEEKEHRKKLDKVKARVNNEGTSPLKTNEGKERNSTIEENDKEKETKGRRGSVTGAKIQIDKYPQHSKDLFKKLTVLCTLFIPEYEILLVSSSNNKITAWQYDQGEFKNVNTVSDFNLEKNAMKCAIQNAESPQYTMVWEPVMKNLYSGQADGKILKWSLKKTKNIEADTLDIKKARERFKNEKNSSVCGIQTFSEEENEAIRQKVAKKKNSVVKIDLNLVANAAKSAETELLQKNAEKNEFLRRENVSCMVVLGNLQQLAAGYYNGNVILWDVSLRDYRKFYNDQQTCIYQITYDAKRNLLFTCGFDHDIFIYDPYIDGSAVYRLVGHNASINSISINNRESELLSIDILGNIKIWDLDNYYNFQSININENYTDRKLNQDIENARKKKKISSNLRMIVLPKINKIMTYGEKLLMFEKNNFINPELCDDSLVVGCFYSPYTYDIYTVCLKKIKLWNVFNGKVRTIYDSPMENEITGFDYDEPMKRIYIGDNLGKIKAFNLKNGHFLKDFPSHKGEIINIFYSTKQQILITFSNDYVIKFHDDKELLETSLLKELNLWQMKVGLIYLDDNNDRIILAGKNSKINYYNIELFRFEAIEKNEEENEFLTDPITNIRIFGEHNIAMFAHSKGCIRFVVLPPNIYKNSSFKRYINLANRDGLEIFSMIRASAYDEETKRLFIGDQFGYIICFELKEMFDLLESFGDEYKPENNHLLKEFDVAEHIYFKISAHKDSIRQLFYPYIKPNIIISVADDRTVKIFGVENKGEYIDQLMQLSCIEAEIPTGLEFEYINPFQSKREETEEVKKGIITRKEIEEEEFTPKSKLNDRTRLKTESIYGYLERITVLNAKEKLYRISVKARLDPEKSNKWKLKIDLDFIKEKEKEALGDIEGEVNKIVEGLKQSEEQFKVMDLNDDSYKPFFINEMTEDNLKEFKDVLSQRLRKSKLSLGKLVANSTKVDEFKREETRKKTINIAASIEALKEMDSPKKKGKKLKKLSPIKIKKLTSSYAQVITKFSNPKDQFNYNRTHVGDTAEEIIKIIDDRLTEKFHKSLLPKIKIVKRPIETEVEKVKEERPTKRNKRNKKEEVVSKDDKGEEIKEEIVIDINPNDS
ncbi:MAG: hypothetical protein MJ252_02620 [archaeon]|nr:hypothetical protein [archaeon]